MVLSPQLGALAATLGGWSGARVAEDQLWLKPPGAGPLLGEAGNLPVDASEIWKTRTSHLGCHKTLLDELWIFHVV